MARRISIEIVGDTSNLERSFNRAGTSAKRFDRDLNRTFRGVVSGSGAFKHLGRSVAFASASFLGGAGLVEVLKSSVESAAGLERQVERARVTFRDASAEVKAFSKTTADTFGIAEEDALRAANSFGAMLKAMGFARGEAAKMSIRLVKLAGNLAALTGKSPEEAFTALQAGIAGRTRGLKQFGIVIDNAAIKQEAFRLGLIKNVADTAKVRQSQNRLTIAQYTYTAAVKKHGPHSIQAARAAADLDSSQSRLKQALAGSTGALTANAKAAALYSLILRQSTDANGAAGRASGKLSQQQRILHAQIRNLQDELGGQLTPGILKATTALTTWLGKSENQARVQRDLHAAVQDVTAVVNASVPVLGAAAAQIDSSIRGLEGLAKGFRAVRRDVVLLTSPIQGFIDLLNAIPRSIGIDIHVGAVKGIAKGVLGFAANPIGAAIAPLRGSDKHLSAADKKQQAKWMANYGGGLATMGPGGYQYGAGYGYDTGGTLNQTNPAALAARRSKAAAAAAAAEARRLKLLGLTDGATGGGGGGGTQVDTVMARLGILLTRAQQTPGLRDDLQILNKEKQHLQARLKVSKGNLDLQQQLADVEGQITSAVTQEQDRLRGLVGSLFQGPLLSPTDEDIKRRLGVTGPGIGKLTGDLAAQNRQFQAEQRDINRLRKRGASDRLISELQDLGPAGAAQVHTLATASKGKLDAFFRQFQLREKLVAKAVRVEMTASVVNLRAGKISAAGAHARATQTSRNTASGHGVVQHNNITITDSRDSERAARKTAEHLQRAAKSTTVQRRGRNPGVSFL